MIYALIKLLEMELEYCTTQGDIDNAERIRNNIERLKRYSGNETILS